MKYQRSIESSTVIRGRGVHTGQLVTVRFLPAEENQGIVFVRDDRGAHHVPASWRCVESTMCSTTLAKDGVRVRTVEHFLAAAFALGITNLMVVLNNEELPILDGSSLEFAAVLREAGIVAQSIPRDIRRIREPFEIRQVSKRIVVTPADALSFQYHLSIPNFTEQQQSYVFSEDDFFSAVGNARTFSTAIELVRLRDQGLVQGLEKAPGFVLVNSESSIPLMEQVLGKSSLADYWHELPFGGVLSYEKPRHPDEAVRHKILDLVGDLALSGSYVCGRFEAFGTGHTDNINLLRTLMNSADSSFG